MSYVSYTPSVHAWKQVKSNMSMHDLLNAQEGNGSSKSVTVVSPEKGVIERAKIRLKRQINSGKAKRKTHSSSRVVKKRTSRKTKTKRKTKKSRKTSIKKKTVKKVKKTKKR